jgi:hypothetical protein
MMVTAMTAERWRLIAESRKLAAFRSPPYTSATMFTEMKESLRQFYQENDRPGLVGFSGGSN